MENCKTKKTLLVRVIPGYEGKQSLLSQTPCKKGAWDNIEYTLEPVDTCDVLLVGNFLKEDISLRVAPCNVWVIMQEPGIKGGYYSAIEEAQSHQQFAKVFTSNVYRNYRYVISQPATPWFVEKSYDELTAISAKDATQQKEGNISWISSNNLFLPGHRRRYQFYQYLQETNNSANIHFLGIDDKEANGKNFPHKSVSKWDSIFPYRYSLAVENASKRDYWTEKIMDCFLAYTLPIYYGCVNIEDYFPEESFIRINITRPKEALAMIHKAVQNNEWEKRLPAIIEARNLVLNQYQYFPHVSKLIQKYYQESPKQEIHLQGYDLVNDYQPNYCKRLVDFIYRKMGIE